MVTFGVWVGITLFAMFIGIYFGGRKTLSEWGYKCSMLRGPQKHERRETDIVPLSPYNGRKADLIS